jgi:glycosyltransferase involved in cell wall biosynthesis
MKKDSLVVDARMINSSGIGTYLKNILPEIAKKFHLTLLGVKEELSVFKWSKDCEIINFDAKIYSIKEQIILPFIVPKSTLFWCPHFNAPLFPIKATKIICTIHDLNHLAINTNRFSLKYQYAKILYRNAVKKSSVLITVSNFSKSELLNYTNAVKEKVKVIYCGVNSAFSKNNKVNIDKKLPENYILFVGNIKPHKNLIILLKAYNNLSKKTRLTYKLVVLGRENGFINSDKEVFKYIEKYNLTDHVFFTGYLDDEKIPLIYKQAKLFVFPSIYEGFGLPILESMASGTPVISSNAASLTEVGGDASIYFNPSNSTELQKKIELVLNNSKLKNEHIEKGFNQIKKFSWDTSSKEHIKLFKGVINNNE